MELFGAGFAMTKVTETTAKALVVKQYIGSLKALAPKPQKKRPTTVNAGLEGVPMHRSRAIVALAIAVAIAGCNGTSSVPNTAPPPLHSIQHVIVMMQENRSFNVIFAGFPGATSAMTAPCEPSPWCKSGKADLKPITLESTDRLGLGTDIDHSHHGFQVECDADSMGNCRNDGFDKIRYGESGTGPVAKLYPISYIERSESKPYWDLAKRYSLADQMFFTDTGNSFISHQIILSGTVRLNDKESLTDQPDSIPWGCDAPKGTTTPVLFVNGHEDVNGPFPCFTQYGTMADLLDAANVSWKYYVRDFRGEDGDFSGGVWNGYDAIKKVRYGPDWKTHVTMPNTQVFNDLKSGALPAVSWVIPSLADSDHPASGCNHGPRWVTSVVDAVGKSKYWDSTAIVLIWDEWGGWFDPVPPPQINYTSLSFRVPMVVISPWARPNTVVHTSYQFGSILKFIEQNFALGSLHTTDETSNSMDDVFDFTQKPSAFVTEPLPHVKPCNGNASPKEIIENAGGVPE